MNDTANSFMFYRTAHEFNQFFLGQTPTKSTPIYYSFNGISGDGDTLVDIYPIPDGVYDLRFNVVLRTDDVTSDADESKIRQLSLHQGAGLTHIHPALAFAFEQSHNLAHVLHTLRAGLCNEGSNEICQLVAVHLRR